LIRSTELLKRVTLIMENAYLWSLLSLLRLLSLLGLLSLLSRNYSGG